MWRYLRVAPVRNPSIMCICPLHYHWTTIGLPFTDIRGCMTKIDRICPDPGALFTSCQYYPGGFECWTSYIRYMQSEE